MDITLNAIAFRNGTPFNTKLNLTQRADGTWHATNFGEIMRNTASKAGTSQSSGRDAHGPEAPVRAKLSDQEIAELADKYNPRSMTRDQYDSFLDNLIEKGALSRFDAMRLGYKGWRVLDIDIGAFATGGIGCGSAYAVGSENAESGPIQSLEDMDGDLIRWLEGILAQLGQEARADSRQREEALNALLNIAKQMAKNCANRH